MLKLVKLSEAYREQLGDMMDEWTATGETIVPCAIVKNDYRDFDRYLAQLEVKEASGGLVPDSVFFCLDDDTNRFVGAVNIRHRLNALLLRSGGHIGDGVRPSERRKGVATRMIAMALEECRLKMLSGCQNHRYRCSCFQSLPCCSPPWSQAPGSPQPV